MRTTFFNMKLHMHIFEVDHENNHYELCDKNEFVYSLK